MKRLALFLLLAGVGTVALIRAGGGIEGPEHARSEPVVTETDTSPESVPRIETGKGAPDIDALEGITQPAPPRRLVWVDRLSDERIEIPTFIPWRFKARDARPLQTADKERQGVLCREVSFQAYRDPETRAEAMALVRNESDAYGALLHQRITAQEASVFGRLGEALNPDGPRRRDMHVLGDTELSLSGDVVIHDRTQGIEIRGDRMTVWPEQDRAQGDGLYKLTHEALVLEGRQLLMERDKAKGWSRVSIQRDPVLKVLAAGRDKQGSPLFDFGEGEFQPATISSSGRAILVRQESRSEVTLSITFSDDVRAVQEGGRSLRAGRAELLAVQGARSGARRSKSWSLQHFHAEQGVQISYPGRTAQGGDYLTSVTAQRLLHDVPAEGRASTVLEGDVLIHLRGEIPVLGPNGRLRLMCRDRAWIGPLPAGAPDAGLERETLQQISLRGQARIERETVGPTPAQDFLEAEALDLVVRSVDGPANAQVAARSPETRMVAVHFAALGDVLVGGTRIRGATRRLVGDGLHTEEPHITAEGEGTRFEFPDLAPDQRLLGPEPATPATAGREDEAAATGADARSKGTWVLQRLLARGAVDIHTSMGGPALGIPAQLSGDEVSYDRLSRLARLVATGAAPASLAWSASPRHTNQVTMRELLLDRSGERITARGGVRGELHVTREGGGRPGMAFPRAAPGAALDGAVLAVRTDARIDVSLRRGADAWSAAPGREQVIRIAGPVTTELRAPDNSVDRMRSESLEVGLVFELPTAPATDAPSTPAARASRGGSPDTSPPSNPTAVFERLDVQADAVRIDTRDGSVAYLEATGTVDLAREGGHVRGERATYDDRGEVIEVTGTTARPATVLLGTSDQRSEVQAEHLLLRLASGRAVGLEATSPAGGTSAVSLYRTAKDRPGQLEWFSVTYEGKIVVTDDLLRAGRVRVIRRLRDPGALAWGAAAVLRSPTLRVLGRHLLTNVEREREILNIVAEGTPASPQDEVHFLSGTGEDRIQIWGQRFDFDVVRKEAQLTGLPGRDVTMRRGDGLHSWYTRVTIDMKTNLPSAEGSRILWRPRDK